MLGVFGDKNEKPEAKAVAQDTAYFGRTDFRSASRLFGIQRRDRRQHMYVIGKTGTGKSVLLHNLIVQDIVNGEGVCVVDPHGELVESVLNKIPASRAKDVIYFNPADTDYPIGFNVLELPDPRYKHLVASGLMGIFTKIWANVWSARMEYIMNNAVLALLDTPNTTLLGIMRILVDKEYRQKIIANLQDPVVKAFWVNEYEEWQDKFRSEAIAPIQNKVGQFLSTPLIRNVVGQSRSTIDVFDLMNKRKILLINVSKGRIGEDNSALLGAMLITKIQLAAMERVRIPEDERKDFYLYVDEFQNFATDSFASTLSEARKYRLNLIMAHQYVGQLTTDTSTKVRDAVFGNVGTMVSFRVGAGDAEFLEPEFEPEFVIQDIVNLPNYHIYLKLMVNGVTSRPFSAKTLPPFKINEESSPPEVVVGFSRQQYASPRVEVEAEINRWASGAVSTAPAASAEELAGGEAVLGKDGKTPMYLAVCSSCGKESRVPFKPSAGRPVYCSECLEKIQAGELTPVSAGEMKRQAERQSKSMETLAGLGIEFERPKVTASKPQAPPRREQASRENRERDERRRPDSGRPAVKKEISLSDLKHDGSHERSRHEPKPGTDIARLKDDLKRALDRKSER